MALAGYIFGGSTNDTPESLARRREVQDALAAQIMGRAPTTALGGVGSLFAGLATGIGRYRDNKSETAGRQKASDLFSSLVGGNKPSDMSTMPTSSTRQSTAGIPAVPGSMANARTADRNSVQNYAGMDMKSGIKSTADSLGIDPADLATAISYETGGTFDPTKGGPTTQWGKHRGLIQFGEPQAKQYGVDWNDPVNTQLGPEGAIAKYLRDAGVQPGMGLRDIYSAINAGKVGRYNASDAKNGGAPGTVDDKVNGMADHRQKALALLGGGEQPDADAQSTMAAMMADPRGQQTQQVQQPVQVADNSSQMPAQQNQQMQAQQPQNALPGVDPKLLQAMSNPWLSQEQKAVIKTLIDQQMQQAQQQQEQQTWLSRQQYEEQQRRSDPAYQQGLKKGELELNALEHPGPDWQIVNGKDGSVFRIDKRTGQKDTLYGPQDDDAIRGLKQRATLAGIKEGTPEFQQFILNGGKDSTPDAIRTLDMRAKSAGLQPGTPEYQQFMLNGGAQKDGTPDAMKTLDLRAKAAGFQPGTPEYQNFMRNVGSTNVNIDQKSEGQFDKTVAEKQAASYSAMADEGMNARADLAVINQLDGLMKGQGGAITGLSSVLSRWGVPFDGTDDIQAANALINKLVPSQRTPGSGTMSDGDVALFKASLPNLWNQPGGNQKIIDTMRGMAKYKQDQGEIADQVMAGEITRQEGRRALRALPNPLADFQAPRAAEKKAEEAAPAYDPNLPFWSKPKPKQPVKIDGYTIEEAN